MPPSSFSPIASFAVFLSPFFPSSTSFPFKFSNSPIFSFISPVTFRFYIIILT
jgi:hypothetical protein